MKTIFTQYFSLIFITLISFCSIAQLTPNGNSGSSTTVYTNAASNNPIYILRNKELIILKADKQAIGSISEELKAFTNHEFDLQTGDLIYLFTDGYADQFGGPDGKKLKSPTAIRAG
jgi:serine phosphatase RsbU (regulator of sigma subunit)